MRPWFQVGLGEVANINIAVKLLVELLHENGLGVVYKSGTVMAVA
jgi:hypothetical protein